MVKISVNNHTYDDAVKTHLESPDMNSFYNLLENTLNKIVNVIVKHSLSQCTTNILYTIVGGKALNKVISTEILSQSFDFDIHTYSKTLPPTRGSSFSDAGYQTRLQQYTETIERDLIRDTYVFGEELATKMNEFLLGFPHIRIYIFELLKSKNILNDTVSDWYKDRENILFYYGKRDKGAIFHKDGRLKRGAISVKGIFMKIKLPANFYVGRTYTNKKDGRLEDSFENESTDEYDDGSNELFYPLCDIDMDVHVNFGILYKSTFPASVFQDGIHYANYVMLFYNLYKYATLPTATVKREKNMNKFNLILHPENYSLPFYDSYPQNP